MKFALGDGAVAEETGRDDAVAAHVVGKRKSDCERQPAPHDGVAAIEVGGAIEEMHGAAATSAAAFLLSIHLGERCLHRYSAHQRMAMLAISSDNPVALVEHGDDTDGDGLLAIIKVHEAPDFLLGVKLGTLLLEAADADHLAQKIKRVRP